MYKALPLMTTAFFQQIPEHLQHYLSSARARIQIAVCWFSHRAIFNELLARVRAGVQVELLLHYDQQNICSQGLDFQSFVDAGGRLMAGRTQGLMHHKFAIVDDQLLLTGSFNWTYNTNAENLVISRDMSLVMAFSQEFERMKTNARQICRVDPSEAVCFSPRLLVGKTDYTLTELRKRISKRANVWLHSIRATETRSFPDLDSGIIPFDAFGLLSCYWRRNKLWDNELVHQELFQLGQQFAPTLIRPLRCWALRIRIDDLIFRMGKPHKGDPRPLVAIGVVQSEPMPYEGVGYSSFRWVHWVKILTHSPYYLPERSSIQSPSRYKGSALRVLQEVLG